MIENTSRDIFKKKCDFVIGIGGGSVLDVTKAASMYENSIQSVDNFAGSKKKYSKKTIKSIAIPTTAGTGSEFTYTSVYKTRSNIKNWLWDELTYFDYVVYLPQLTFDLPKDITLSSGIDAFDHLIESLMSKKIDGNNLDFCNYGLNITWKGLTNLNESLNNFNERTNMLLGSGIGGKAIHFTGCGICHCIAHTLGSLTRVPHGVAISYALFHTIEPVLKYQDELLSRFKGCFENTSAVSLSKLIQDWISGFEIRYGLIEKKICFDKFIEIYYLDNNKSMRENTYYQPTKSDLKILLSSLWN